MPPDLKILLVGDFPPPSGGVATHVEELFRAVRARGGQCEVLDIGKGQLPSDGVRPAGGVARSAWTSRTRAATRSASRGPPFSAGQGSARPKASRAV